jgi:hypothetical protein
MMKDFFKYLALLIVAIPVLVVFGLVAVFFLLILPFTWALNSMAAHGHCQINTYHPGMHYGPQGWEPAPPECLGFHGGPLLLVMVWVGFLIVAYYAGWISLILSGVKAGWRHFTKEQGQ